MFSFSVVFKPSFNIILLLLSKLIPTVNVDILSTAFDVKSKNIGNKFVSSPFVNSELLSIISVPSVSLNILKNVKSFSKSKEPKIELFTFKQSGFVNNEYSLLSSSYDCCHINVFLFILNICNKFISAIVIELVLIGDIVGAFVGGWDGEPVGAIDGGWDGADDGLCVGSVGAGVGGTDGVLDGAKDGERDGAGDGAAVVGEFVVGCGVASVGFGDIVGDGVVGSIVGFAVGAIDGDIVGAKVGGWDGDVVGAPVGGSIGEPVGKPVGAKEGAKDGAKIGAKVGGWDGEPVGAIDGRWDGALVGVPVGGLLINVGVGVGAIVSFVGANVGLNDGEKLGAFVGDKVVNVGDNVGSDVLYKSPSISNIIEHSCVSWKFQ